MLHNLDVIYTHDIMHNAYRQDLDSLCYHAHSHRRDHMCFAYCNHMTRRENHGMISRNPKFVLNRSRA